MMRCPLIALSWALVVTTTDLPHARAQAHPVVLNSPCYICPGRDGSWHYTRELEQTRCELSAAQQGCPPPIAAAGSYPTPLSSAYTGETVNYCSAPDLDTQRRDISFRNMVTRSGLCYRCISPDNEQGYLSEEDDAELARANGYPNPAIFCEEINDQECLPRSTGPASPRCAHSQDEASPLTDPGFSPQPGPGPSGEVICNTDCKSEANTAECSGGVRICHTYSKCSDGSLLICDPGPCGGVLWCD